MEHSNEMQVAVLIDAENIASKYTSIILQEASSLGTIVCKRVYGDWSSANMNSWRKELMENAIQPIQQYSYTTGKNASDSALIIDAMDLLYQKQLDAFCLVTSDSDFTRLATRMREDGMFVLGMGEKKTARSFISACNKFSYLDLLYKEQKASKEKNKKKQNKTKAAAVVPAKGKKTAAQTNGKKTTKGSTSTDDKQGAHISEDLLGDNGEILPLQGGGSDIAVVSEALREIAEEFSGDDGWVVPSILRDVLVKRLPDFDTRNFGFKKFLLFVESLNMFEKRVDTSDKNDQTVYLRLIEE